MSSAQDGTGVVKVDSWLEPFSDSLRHRYKAYLAWVDTLNQYEGGLEKFSRGYKKLGFIVAENGDITYREWAPNATSAHLMGDFSTSHMPLNPANSQTIGTVTLFR
jgi:1,4-alpha-glucan branching enzyme